ncbi:MAG: hydroxyethylthiazole kinase [Desulfobacterales bacterium]|nr:MAG: hydroxyethylthiazole kinase [Desulfobacterales bacterium]
MAAAAGDLLRSLRKSAPLVHNITNFVTMNFIANALLAVGASPVMAHAIEEAGEMTGLADALCLNIGTLTPGWVDAMEAAAAAAVQKGIPAVLDPVGAGATLFRTEQARRIMYPGGPRPFPPAPSRSDSRSGFPSGIFPLTVIRGNASEILSLLQQKPDGKNGTRGVDSIHGVDKAMDTAVTAARQLGCLIAVTGVEDCVTDGFQVLRIANGHPLMPRITGTGCVATALIAAFLAAGRARMEAGHPDDAETDSRDGSPSTSCSSCPENDLISAAAALSVIGLAGETAASGAAGPGSFSPRFLDALYALTPEALAEGSRIRWEPAPPDAAAAGHEPKGGVL